jgi:hypothetical protein
MYEPLRFLADQRAVAISIRARSEYHSNMGLLCVRDEGEATNGIGLRPWPGWGRFGAYAFSRGGFSLFAFKSDQRRFRTSGFVLVSLSKTPRFGRTGDLRRTEVSG